ncbi:MAG: SufE family protein, partial [Chloroflexota bacterium]
MNHACEFLNEMGEDLASLESRHDKLLTLRQYGEYLETLDPAMKSDSTMVPGCASATYMIADLQTDGTMRFYGDSE